MINLLSKINIFSENDYKKEIENSLKLNNNSIFFYLNSQILYEANKNLEWGNYVLNSDFLIADGYSIVLLYKKVIMKNIEKVVFTYSYFKFLREFFIKDKTSIFFLGATENVINKCVETEKEQNPGINIVGWHNGYFSSSLNSDVINKINSSNAQVLIVGMGFPLAEKWIIENRDYLKTKVIFSVGGFFDFLAKDKRQAPKWMYNSGFEWLFRLIQEPKRLWKRYLISNIYWLFAIFILKFKHAKN